MRTQIEYVDRDEVLANDDAVIKLWLRVVDPKKRRDKHKENEAIEFTFTIDADDADEVAHALVSHCTSIFRYFNCN